MFTNILMKVITLFCNKTEFDFCFLELKLKKDNPLICSCDPSCLILLYGGLVGSVLKYGSVCFKHIAKTHMLGLERVQYRALRIALGLMGSTPNNFLDVLSGIPPLAERFTYFNFRYLVVHSLRERFGVLGGIWGIFRCFIIGYSSIRVFCGA
jgi:hypothetical protein